MRKLRVLAATACAFALAVGLSTVMVRADSGNPQQEAGLAASTAALTDCQRRSAANGSGQEIFLSTVSPKTYTGTGWQNVDCTTTTFRLAFGQRALVTSNFNAEADCNGTTPTNGQWCLTRALLNGSEGAPIAAEPSSFAFDSVAGGVNNWQAHSMSRAWEIRCGLSDGCQYKFAVQTRMHDSSVTGMWLDDLATTLRVTYGNPAPL